MRAGAGCGRSGGGGRGPRRRGDDGAARRARRARSPHSLHDHGHPRRRAQGPQPPQGFRLGPIRYRLTRLVHNVPTTHTDAQVVLEVTSIVEIFKYFESFVVTREQIIEYIIIK